MWSKTALALMQAGWAVCLEGRLPTGQQFQAHLGKAWPTVMPAKPQQTPEATAQAALKAARGAVGPGLQTQSRHQSALNFLQRTRG